MAIQADWLTGRRWPTRSRRSRRIRRSPICSALPVRMAVNRELSGRTRCCMRATSLPCCAVSGPDACMHHDAPIVPARVTDLCAPVRAVVTSRARLRRRVLDYEAYREMGRSEWRIKPSVCSAMAWRRRPPSTRGRVALGAGVVVAVSGAPDAAFAGARELIDRIKAEAPIWKRSWRREASWWRRGVASRGRAGS